MIGTDNHRFMLQKFFLRAFLHAFWEYMIQKLTYNRKINLSLLQLE